MLYDPSFPEGARRLAQYPVDVSKRITPKEELQLPPIPFLVAKWVCCGYAEKEKRMPSISLK